MEDTENIHGDYFCYVATENLRRTLLRLKNAKGILGEAIDMPDEAEEIFELIAEAENAMNRAVEKLAAISTVREILPKR